MDSFQVSKMPFLGSVTWDPYQFLRAVGLIAGLSVLYFLAVIIYRITIHPLAKVPGPRHRGAMYLPFLYSSYIEGSSPRKTLELHKRYGPIVRTGPNHIALDGEIGWPEVFGHRTKGQLEFNKPYNNYFPGDHLSLIGAPKERHRRMRRQLGHAFSDAALIEQESTIKSFVDLLISRFAEMEKQQKTFNMVDWLNFTTFDIIGELAFTDSFDSLKNNGYHPWVGSIFRGIRGGALLRFLKQYPLLKFIVTELNLSKEINVSFENRALAKEKAQKRMELGLDSNGTRDFMTYMMRKTRTGEQGMSAEEILASSPLIVVAGSETTATALSGLFFYLSQNPEKRSVLVNEIRGAFDTEDDITIRKAAALEYLHACLEETLRMYPPAAETPPRESPGAMLGGYWIPKGTRISVYQWATFRNPAHFAEPDSFNPERWLPDSHQLYNSKFAGDNKTVFKPFSYGTRDCVGKNLAYSEMRLIAARIMWRFDVEINGQEDWHNSQRAFVVWEKGPLNTTLRQRADI